jgi:hypothetical protein
MFTEATNRCDSSSPPLAGGDKGRGGFPSPASPLLWIMIVALAFSVSACGKKSAPEPPDPQSDHFPRQYPDPTSL